MLGISRWKEQCTSSIKARSLAKYQLFPAAKPGTDAYPFNNNNQNEYFFFRQPGPSLTRSLMLCVFSLLWPAWGSCSTSVHAFVDSLFSAWWITSDWAMIWRYTFGCGGLKRLIWWRRIISRWCREAGPLLQVPTKSTLMNNIILMFQVSSEK